MNPSRPESERRRITAITFAGAAATTILARLDYSSILELSVGKLIAVVASGIFVAFILAGSIYLAMRFARIP